MDFSQKFEPSRRILEAIAFDEDSFNGYMILPGGNEEKGLAEAAQAGGMMGLMQQAREYYNRLDSNYRLPIELHEAMNGEGGTFILLCEAMANARIHGLKSQPGFYIVGTWMGRKGICFGFNDGGEYFKRPEIKETFERKLPVPEFDNGPHLPGGSRRVGVGEIYDYSDIIEVDNKKGVLYCVQFLNRVFNIKKRD